MELIQRLLDADENELAKQVISLRIFGRCGCGEAFCTSILTASEQGSDRCVGLGSDLILDIVDEKIVFVELLDRPEIKTVVDRLFATGFDGPGRDVDEPTEPVM